MSLGTILLIVLILLLVGALPSWGHSKRYVFTGYPQPQTDRLTERYTSPELSVVSS